MMDRRQFGRFLVALFAGRAVVEIAAGTAPGLLLEDARTNIMDGPGGDFNDAVWTPPRGIMNANTIAVDKLAGGWRHIVEVHRA